MQSNINSDRFNRSLNDYLRYLICDWVHSDVLHLI